MDVDSDSVLCAEILGWFMNRLQLDNGDWVMVLEEDGMLSLTANLMIRGPNAINCVVGLPHTNLNSDVRSAAGNCVRFMKDITVLPFISFNSDVI